LPTFPCIPLTLKCGIAETITLLPSLFFLFSLSTSLVPSPLLEFRYFIIPYLIVRLHIETPGRERERKWRLRLESLGYGAVGVAAVGLFLRGFESGQGVERFMW
jgi:alpha-1,2-glucosyltransferase